MSETEKTGAIVYTDGGARPTNPGPAGYGYHGYVYSYAEPKKGTGDSKIVPTSVGYDGKDAKALKGQKVTVQTYFNGHGSMAGLNSNNVAEILATTHGLLHLTDKSLSEIMVISDSQGVVKACNEYMGKWIRNNWIKSNGEPVANLEHWKDLNRAIQLHQDNGIKVSFRWTAAHVGEPGNEAADRMATLACVKSQRGLVESKSEEHDASGFWSKRSKPHALLSDKVLYFTTIAGSHTPGHYFLGQHGDDDTHWGKRMTEGRYTYLELNTPDPAVETLISEHFKASQGETKLFMCNVDAIAKRFTYDSLLSYGEHAIYQAKDNRIVFKDLSDEIISTEIVPALLGWRAAEIFALMVSLLSAYRQSDPKIKVTDVTDRYYDTGPKGKTLKKELGSGFTELKVSVNNAINDTPTEVTLTCGSDIFTRNALKRIEMEDPIIHVLTLRESEKAFRYYTVVKCSQALSISGAVFANNKLVT